MLISGVGAVLLLSPDAKALAEFYVSALGLPLVEEVHDEVPVHYACDLGSVHFAIHPADGWPGTPTLDSQSPVIALNTLDAGAVADSLRAAGIDASGPIDHGFACVVSFRDPDGNHIEVLEVTVAKPTDLEGEWDEP